MYNVILTRGSKIALTGIFLCFLFRLSDAQTMQNPRIVPGVLHIKYQTESAGQSNRQPKNVTSRQIITQFMQPYGVTQITPLWNSNLENKLRNQIRSGTIQPKANLQEITKELRQIETIYYSSEQDPRLLAAKINTIPGVAYAEPHYMRHLTIDPNDPGIQSNIELMNFPNAWDISQGSKEVVIAIIDSGVDYTHDDLDDNLWVNQAEIPPGVKSDFDTNNDGIVSSSEIKEILINSDSDLNGDGVVNLQDALHPTSALMDGADNDQNNFADDLFGWDFWESGISNNTITSDNDPIGSGSNHGTHVAGIAAAEANNNFGIAGTGFNISYMAVKAGGIPDDPATSIDESAQIGFGFEGIIYAASNSADVINTSWGGGGRSQVEQDIINAVSELGIAVIASAGNSNIEGSIFPAGYTNVLSVGSIDHQPGVEMQKSSFSNFGFDVDVFATGNFIQSTVFDNALGFLSGTSMSSPAVAGLAGLLKAEHPDWTAPQILMQIRNSSEFIDEFNLILTDKMGHGLIDAERALGAPLPGIRITDSEFINQNGSKLGLGEPGIVKVDIENVGASASDLKISVVPIIARINIQTSEISVGAVAQGDSTQIEVGLELDSDFNIAGPDPAIQLIFTDASTGYEDRRVLEYTNLLFDTIDNNASLMSVGSEGTIGFTQPFSQAGGVGFVPRVEESGQLVKTRNQLFEGGLMISVNDEIASAVRGTEDTPDRDFKPEEIFRLEQPGLESDLDGKAVFISNHSSPVRVTAQSFSFTAPELSNVIFLRYDVENLSSTTLENVRIGLFNDWDVGQFDLNTVAFSTPDSLMYVHDVNDDTQPYVTVAHMGEVASTLAIENGFSGVEDSLNFNIFNSGDMPGFSDQEKLWSLNAGTAETSTVVTDVSMVVAAGPFALEQQETVTTGFIYAWGATLDELRSQVANARALNLFEVGDSSVFTDFADEQVETPRQTKLHPNFPNPFNPSTQIQFDLSRAGDVDLTVYNILGQKVVTLVNQRMTAGTHQIQFDASRLSSGLYLGVLRTGSQMQTIKMNLIK